MRHNNQLIHIFRICCIVVLSTICSIKGWAIDQENGVYQITNAQDLREFADIVNGANGKTKNLSANALLTANIDLGGSTNGNWVSMGTSAAKYQGTFDGAGHTISGFYQSFSGTCQGTGLFGFTSGAKILNFRLTGSVDYSNTTNSSYFLSTVVGNGTGTTIEDVSSSVNMTFKEGSEQTRIIGGIAGRNDGLINRCRYNGTINLGARNIQKVAGICASSFGVTITNCLFDGSIISSTTYTDANKVISGGILGYDETKRATIAYCISLGTITLSQSPVSTNVGAVWGQNAGTQVTTTNVYYTTENVTKNGSVLDQFGGANSSGANATNGLIALTEAANRNSTYWENLRNTLKSENWHIETGSDAPAYPIPGKTTDCNHEYSESGWCGKCAARKPLEQNTDGTYLIDCLAQFASFRDLVNKSAGAELNAKFTNDMDFNLYPGYLGEPIGYDNKNPYHGTFDGDGHKIIAVHIDGRHNYIGQFGYINNATIKNLQIAGDINIYSSCTHVGSIAGYATGECHFEDILSSMTLNLDAQDDVENTAYHDVKVIGGIVGKAENTNSTINRCRFNGTISSQQSYDRIGGIVGETANCNLTNDLFDGTISIAAPSSEIIVGGLVGQLSGMTNYIKNCLSHGTINQTSTKAGTIIGYADNKPLTLDRVLYTACGSITSAYGSASTGSITTFNAYPWDITEGTKLSDGEAYQILGYTKTDDTQTVANWKQDAEGAYPIPSNISVSHTHDFNANGFCKANDGNYQPITAKATDGYYSISNAGQFWWVVQQMNAGSETITINSNIKLANNIDMEGERYGSFVGMAKVGKTDNNADDWTTAFHGIFDGKGYTISNYYSTQSGIRMGMFNAIKDGTVKHFKINGKMIANSSANLQGVVVGAARGNSLIEDIHSSVNIEVTNATGVGGIVGTMENNNTPDTKMNRCRYDGTITVYGNSESKNSGIGGLCGQLRSAIITNCLFDGTINVENDAKYDGIGGIVGLVCISSNSEMHRILTHGTLSLGTLSDSKRCGIVVGAAETTLYMSKCFHTTTNTGSLKSFIGPHTGTQTDNETNQSIIIDYLLGISTDKTNELVDLYSSAFRTTLGKPNWAAVTNGYTYPLKEEEHIHEYSNGFCTSGDGEYERPNFLGNVYQIYNGGNLYWFAEHFNAGEISEIATVELMTDIDMEGDKYSFPGIGSIDCKFKGTFRGKGNKINRFYRAITNGEYNGFINYAEDAIIENFNLYGNIDFNFSATKSFHGTVVGIAIGNNTAIDGINSFVDVKINNQFTRVLGGIVGRAQGKISHCRYGGTISGDQEHEGKYYTNSGRQIGGICANAINKILIENCLFDGSINSRCLDPVMRVCGILASNEKESAVDIVIKNCLFNGCLDLDHIYTGTDKDTQNGIIAGYWDTDKKKSINNIYYLKKCAKAMANLGIGRINKDDDPQKEDISNIIEITGEPNWQDIKNKLDPTSNNWYYESSSVEGYPVPNANICNHKDSEGKSTFNEFGFCGICGARKQITIDTDNKYKITCLADLATFRDMVNNKNKQEGEDESTPIVYNAKLMTDLDFENFQGDLGQPIGNSYYNRYLYNFDGQGYSIKNIRIESDLEYVGLFGFAGDPTHECYIHDFTLTGYINVPYQSSKNEDKPLYAGVVGRMFNGKIENVHSELTISNQNETRIVLGGILGSSESESESNSVTITKCSYTGASTINGYGEIGGIVGKVSQNTQIDHCTFAGSMDHIYEGDIQMTQFGGIAGYNESIGFKGIQNCVIAGSMKTKINNFKNYGEAGNHKNALTGEDVIITNGPSDEYKGRFTGNFALNVYKPLIPTNSIVEATYTTPEQFAGGEICAALNALDDKPADVQNGHPWGQILGYQVGDITKGELQGAHTEGSPAQRVPFPGYQNPEKVIYKVLATENAQDKTKKDYIVDWYYFDDAGDATPLPTDVSSVKVKHIEYTRTVSGDGGMSGYNSFCLPFDFTSEMIANGTKLYQYKETDGTTVKFNEITTFPIPGGTPFIMYCESADNTWSQRIDNSEGTAIAIKAGSQLTSEGSENEDGCGIIGSFDTKNVGTGYYKIKSDGTKLVKTTSASSCFPYRAYLKLPAQQVTQATQQKKAFSARWIPFILGDINGDGNVSIVDVSILTDKINTRASSEDWDLNNDGLINTEDIKIIISKIAGKEENK